MKPAFGPRLEFLGILLVILGTEIQFSHQFSLFESIIDGQQSACRTRGGSPGKCVPIVDCPEKEVLILSPMKPKICSWLGNMPVICCPGAFGIANSLPGQSENGKKRGSVETIGDSNDVRNDGGNDEVMEHPTERITTFASPDKDLNLPNCGTRMVKQSRSRIVGGSEAYPGEFPWSVAIFGKQLDDRMLHECGGAIITDRYVLTAAHCFTTNDPSNYMIGVGSRSLKNVTKYQIESIIVHKDYSPSFYYNDIALIKTRSRINFTRVVRPVCLPFDNDKEFPGDDVTIAGWGYLKFGGQKTDILNKAYLNLVSRRKCNTSYAIHNSSKIPKGISEEFICAGVSDYSRDACEADSGGALVKRSPVVKPTRDLEGRFVQIGVVSFGYKCAHSGYPGVYTRVAHFIDWIKSHINLTDSRWPDLR